MLSVKFLHCPGVLAQFSQRPVQSVRSTQIYRASLPLPRSTVQQGQQSGLQPTTTAKAVRSIATMASSTPIQPHCPSFPSLVSADWLQRNLHSVKVLDATWYLPTVKDKDAIEQFTQERIPGAQFFDLDGISDTSVKLPHMLPSASQFAAAADTLGISNEDIIVVYDRQGMFSSPRAWWTWHVLGHEKAAVLDGGLPAWKESGGEVEKLEVDVTVALAPSRAAQRHQGLDGNTNTSRYKARLNTECVRNWRDILSNVETKQEIVVDARPASRWKGLSPEPRPGLKQGRIPGSVNIPWDAVQNNGKMKSVEELRIIFKSSGAFLEGPERMPLVMSCGSGTTACILALAAKQVDPTIPAVVYDGSWSEWGALVGVPVVRDEP